MRIVKKALEIGNGAAVYVPREYRGKEIVIILPEGVDELKKRILGELIEFMPNIAGAYLYGSYARGEESQDSDIDLLIIVEKKDDGLKKALEEFDARIMTLEEVKKSIENFPALIIPILQEAKTLINPILIGELRNSRIDFKKFRWHFDDSRRIISIIKKFVELDGDISVSHVYSLLMRIRVCHMIDGLIRKKEFSNRGVERILSERGVSKDELKKLILAYREIRDYGKSKARVEKEEILKLASILEEYLNEVENEAQKKA